VNRFPIRFDPWYRALSAALFISPSDSYVEVNEHDVVVRMAWAFRARFPRSAIRTLTPASRRPVSRGVHGFRGRWLVNGSGKGLLSIQLDPPATGFTLGLPVRIRELLVSVEEPHDLAHLLLGPREALRSNRANS
jgi:hypothetical protein